MSEPEPASRRTMLRTLGGTAAIAAAGALAACGSSTRRPHGREPQTSTAPTPIVSGETILLNHLLDLENEAIATYTAVIPLLSGSAHIAAKRFLAQELSHAVAIGDAIGGAGGRGDRPRASYNLGHPSGREGLLRLLEDLERAQFTAYLDALLQLQPGPLRATVTSIAAVEAQHIAVLRLALGENPIPTALVTGREPVGT